VLVVGGTYRERCHRPSSLEIFGSGLRAAAALRVLDPEVELITAIDPVLKEEAAAAASGRGLRVAWLDRDEPVGFDYFTPLSSPTIDGREAELGDAVRAEARVALVYGMIERGPRQIRTETLVLDPQQPRELSDLNLEGFHFGRLAIVVNASEVQALGGSKDVVSNAQSVLQKSRADVVVVKRAAQGALVVTAEGVESIGAYVSERVWPIGSGDVFAAGFAWGWGEAGMDPVTAARVGSLSASWWCGSQQLPIPRSIGRLETDRTELPPRPVQVYLAGPFFTLGEQWLVELSWEALKELGAEVFSPLHDVGPGGPPVAAVDLDGLNRSQSMLAILDGADPGTWFEIGWARKAGLPVVGYCNPQAREDLKMAEGTDVEVQLDLSTAIYRAIWAGMRVA